MSKYRYPGVKPFSAEDKNIFFGRKEDIDKLLKIISLNKLTVIYSKSGFGKSSLIQAGLISELQKKSKIFQIRFNNYINNDLSNTPLQTVKSSIFLVLKSFLNKIVKKERTLWYYIKNRQLYQKMKNETKSFVLIFDQAEELFSYPEQQINEFINEFTELVRNSVPQKYIDGYEEILNKDANILNSEELDLFYEEIELKIIISIRSDKLSFLDRLKKFIPNILTNTYELLPLNRFQAIDAIINPLYSEDNFLSPPFDFSPDALELIINYLSKNNTKIIETFQIQILCQYCENLVIQKKNKSFSNNGFAVITHEDLGDIESIYENFYILLIKKFQKSKRHAVKLLIEDNLIVNEERVSLPDKTILNFEGITSNILTLLVDTHIIRGQENSVGGISYELSHDTLIKPILKERNIRIERENKLKEYLRAKEMQEIKRSRTILIVGLSIIFVSFISIFISREIFQYNLKNNNDKSKKVFDSIVLVRNKEIQYLENQIKKYQNDSTIIYGINSKIFPEIKNSDEIYTKLMTKFSEDTANDKIESARICLKYCLKLKISSSEKSELIELLESLK